MPEGWRNRLKLIAVTAGITSVGWLAVGVWWYVERVGLPFATSVHSGSGDRVASRNAPGANALAGEASSARPPQPRHRVGELIVPVAGKVPEELEDTFHQVRDGGTRIHGAIDIPAPLGTPVLAASAGSVEKLFLSYSGGRTIYIRSPDRERVYYYAHLNDYAAGLSEGQFVRKGQQIGTVGYSGNGSPDAPHLHFEIMAIEADRKWYERKASINPYPLLAGTKSG